MKRINLGTDTSGRPLVVDSRTLAKLREAERRLGFSLTIVQGSYRGAFGAAASAGTHNRGGVIDLRTWDLPAGTTPQQVVRVLRECGLIAWYRTKAQGFDPHIHAIDYGNPDLDPSAARQVAAWEQGRNGLANNGPDDGPRVKVPKAVPKPPKKTPLLTAFRLAPTVALRVAAARRIVRRGSKVLRADAQAYIDARAEVAAARKRRTTQVKAARTKATAQIQAATKRAKAARRRLLSKEVQ